MPGAVARSCARMGGSSQAATASLADTAESVTAVDVSAEAVAFASERYTAANLSFLKVDAERPLPFPDRQFDVVLSFLSLVSLLSLVRVAGCHCRQDQL